MKGLIGMVEYMTCAKDVLNEMKEFKNPIVLVKDNENHNVYLMDKKDLKFRNINGEVYSDVPLNKIPDQIHHKTISLAFLNVIKTAFGSINGDAKIVSFPFEILKEFMDISIETKYILSKDKEIHKASFLNFFTSNVITIDLGKTPVYDIGIVKEVHIMDFKCGYVVKVYNHYINHDCCIDELELIEEYERIFGISNFPLKEVTIDIGEDPSKTVRYRICRDGTITMAKSRGVRYDLIKKDIFDINYQAPAEDFNGINVYYDHMYPDFVNIQYTEVKYEDLPEDVKNHPEFSKIWAIIDSKCDDAFNAYQKECIDMQYDMALKKARHYAVKVAEKIDGIVIDSIKDK